MAHKSYTNLAKKLEKARQLVEVGALYSHYKDKEKRYKVLGIALREDTEEACVVYQTSHISGLIWVRNLDDWLALVVNSKGEKIPRFEKIKENN